MATASLFLKRQDFGNSRLYSGFSLRLACEQAPYESGNKFGERSVNPAAKLVGVGAWIRERSEWDAGEPVDIVFDASFRPFDD